MAATRAAGDVFAEPVSVSGVCDPAIPSPIGVGAGAGDRGEADCTRAHCGYPGGCGGAGLASVAEFVDMVADGHRDSSGAKRGVGGDGPAELF